ncbi:hypothetical protein LZ554_007931 [Drepanopeziza brunnea f. sp. 'monogermtubi']|nr:hypothetical protein LZ554_007931 [Drepanopeziza brunnea f. sp. 'monogermtubi']
MATLRSLVLLVVGLGVLVSAQSVQPSNVSFSESDSMTSLQLNGGAMFDERFYAIAPLTENVGLGMSQTAVGAQAWNGALTAVDYTSVGNLNNTDIAFLSCDPNGSNINPSDVVRTAGDRKPAAIVLYSLNSQECNLTGLYPYTTMYTMTSRQDSTAVLNFAMMFASQGGGPIATRIGVNNGTSSGPDGTQQSGDAGSTPGSPGPTTAVAMSVLYSLTGIITLLFLVIIAAGAVRAHRHPERYGPRNGSPGGRPRQSRAKGLSRAILETLPTVKFGDPGPVKPSSVELEEGRASPHDAPTDGTTVVAAATTQTREGETRSSSQIDSGPVGVATDAASVKSGDEASPDEGNLGCSICTEDFTTGEDVRVLPCNHKYHPACIDPWLLNVSGTCPLCRHDLRPPTSAGPNVEGATNADGELPPPLSLNEGGVNSEGEGTHHRHRVSRLLDLSRLRHAPPDERIAALRQLREETQRTGESTTEVAEEPSRRARLTRRLRDTFRIRTRAQNDNTTS